MASSSSSPIRSSYDVFLSFRGADVRKNFVDHLYEALVRNGIRTYIDDEELSKGEEISPAFMEAIEDSQIAIVVFSKDYASSTWCLDEVAKIMECKEQKHLEVFPLFYKVEPREVRTPRTSYKESMDKHKGKYGEDSEKVKRWKNALLKAGSLSGWHFTDGYEAELIQHIVREISTRVDRTHLHVAKYPVGLDSRVQEVKTILNLQSKDDVLMVGLWGQGGVGKTTLAKAIYNAVFREFQGSCFLERVRENSESSNDLVALQEKLLSQVSRGTEFKVYSAPQGRCLIQDRLRNKKVLIILDDVDNKGQLDDLAGNCQWFGNGSRIVITTRNKQHLISHGVSRDRIYEVEALEKDQALELFRKHAFPRNQKIEISSNLVERVLYYANGLPLALEVLGSFLCGRGECGWKSTLKALAESPRKEINTVLKVSYDGLERNEREIFLDIACFFKGCETEYIKKVLDSCGFEATIGVDVLIERSLIREEGRSLQMHDLLQSMGMDIVKQECHDDPGERSRLWLREDVADVLSGDAGTAKIKAIVLRSREREEMYIDPNAFTRMRNLGLLILEGVDNSFQGPTHLSSKLRWLEWPNCGWFPEFSPGPKKLAGLVMPKSKIKVVPEQFKGFENLKFINMSECQSLVCMPDLSCTPNLEKLKLRGCQNLEHVHDSIGYHRKLKLLDLKGCSKFRRFPDIRDKNESLLEVILNGTSVEELPASIANLISLKRLYLENCKELAILPSSIYRLQNLSAFMLGGCSKLIKFPKEEEEDSSDPHTKIGFPKLRKLFLGRCNLSEAEFLENLSCFPLLQALELDGNNFTSLPTCEQLHHLLVLSVWNCQQLQEIPKIPEKLKLLRAALCKSLSRVPLNILDVEVVSLDSCQELFGNGLSVDDLVKPEHLFSQPRSDPIFLPGREMPKWFLPNKEGYMSFVASKDLYERFLGVAFCVACQVERGGVLHLQITAYANGRQIKDDKFHSQVRNSYSSDFVWLGYCKGKDSWGEDNFGPNDLIHFCFCIRVVYGEVTVKKCGFRVICKPLDNDLEDLFQELLDPALFYKIGDEDSQMSLGEERPRETEDLHNFADFPIEKLRYSKINPAYRKVHPGGEMPKDFILVEGDTISFTASQDLYNKFTGLALCVAFGVEDGEKEVSFDIVPQVQGQRRNGLSGTLGSFDSDHVWIQYLQPNMLWGLLEGKVDFGQFVDSDLRFTLTVRVLGGTMKKLGYLLGYLLEIQRSHEDLEVEFQKDPFVFLSLHKDSDEPTDEEKPESTAESTYPEQLGRSSRYLYEPELEAIYSDTD